jgi:hypothetical protein
MALPQKNRSRFFKERFCMRPLLISALAATLMGCTCFAPQQAQQVSLTGCTEANGFACSDGASGKPQIAAKKENPRHRRKANTHTKNAKSDIVSKTDTSSSSVQPDDKSNTVRNAKSTITVKTETPQSSQVDDKSDPVIKKAKATIAAKMENPDSVEFVEIKRADRKDELGKSVDTVCGYVRGKNTSGGETGDRPFLYLVQEDEAYIGAFMATTAYRYRNICNWEAGYGH